MRVGEGITTTTTYVAFGAAADEGVECVRSRLHRAHKQSGTARTVHTASRHCTHRAMTHVHVRTQVIAQVIHHSLATVAYV